MFMGGVSAMEPRSFSQPGLSPLTVTESIALECIRQIIAEGRRVTNAEICAAIGSDNIDGGTGPGVLKRLERKGYITRAIHQRGMQVCDTFTGKCSAPPANTAPHWRLIYDRSRDSTPSLPRHKVSSTVPTLMAYLDKMMREENITLETAQLTLMARGMQQREEERAA